MQLSAVSALCLLSFALLSSASPRANRQDHRPSTRLRARGSSVSRLDGQIMFRKGLNIMERPEHYEEHLVPKCAGKYAKVRSCELSCRCNAEGRVLCGTELGFAFTSLFQRNPADKEAVAQATLVSKCSSICSCSHLTPEHFGILPEEATTSGAGPSSSHAGPSSSHAGPSTSEAGPSTYNAGPSRLRTGSSNWVPGPGARMAGFAASKAGPSTSDAGPSTSRAGPSRGRAESSNWLSRPAIRMAGPAASEAGPAASEAGPAASEAGPSASEAGPSTSDAGPSTSEAGPSGN